MIARSFSAPKTSFFLFGPRGVGKSSLVRDVFREATYLDLLKDEIYRKLLTRPGDVLRYVPSAKRKSWIILDEVQRVPAILNEVHRLIESEKMKFILTGSSARKLRRGQANLLAGRALLTHLYPLTAHELRNQFSLQKALTVGTLPGAYFHSSPEDYLHSYVQAYLREEVLQEGLVRRLDAFGRFLEAASFSQASLLNISKVAEDCVLPRKTCEGYFEIIEDLLIARRLPIFSRRSKRSLVAHSKFFYFDVGLFRTLRPQGPLDSDSELTGPSLETLVLNEISALNDYLHLGYEIFFWRTTAQHEVDFVLYGRRGLVALDVQRSRRVRREDLRGLLAFREDYPMAEAILLYGGEEKLEIEGIRVISMGEFFSSAANLLKR
jgi:predicted AAA+ superfamily ATPase